MHGFSSATAVHETAVASRGDRRQLVILYCGDADPSGRYMSEIDLPARLRRYGGQARILRIALTDSDLPGLPSFKAKPSDPRYRWYKTRYGEDAWELDALDPNILRTRVEEAILGYIDSLNELDTTNVEPMAQVVSGQGAAGFTYALRADELRSCLPHEEALRNAPQSDGVFFKVPKVIER